MLNPARRTETIYFLNEVLQDAGLGEKEIEPFIASLVARATRETVGDAFDFIDEKIEEGFLEQTRGLPQGGLVHFSESTDHRIEQFRRRQLKCCLLYFATATATALGHRGEFRRIDNARLRLFLLRAASRSSCPLNDLLALWLGLGHHRLLHWKNGGWRHRRIEF